MKKGALLILGIIKLIFGIALVNLGSGFGILSIILGVVLIIVALAQKSSANTKISDIKIDSAPSRSFQNENNNEEVY